MVFAPANAVAAHWFLRYRSTAIAIISGGAGLGGIIYPIMIERLLGQFGYRNTMLTLAGFNFMLMLPSVFFMKARLPPRAPPPLSYLKRPWKEPRYCFLVAASALYAMK
jgi:MFS family permease